VTGSAWGECSRCAEMISLSGMGTLTDPYMIPKHRCSLRWLAIAKIILKPTKK
jgi:hypothetical protein